MVGIARGGGTSVLHPRLSGSEDMRLPQRLAAPPPLATPLGCSTIHTYLGVSSVDDNGLLANTLLACIGLDPKSPDMYCYS